MTTACTITLGISLLLYLAATLLFQGNILLHRSRWDGWGRGALLAGIVVHSFGMVMHFTFSGKPILSNMLVVISLLTIVLLAATLLAERYAGVRHLSLLAAPLAFFALLYALLMPIRFDEAESVLLRYPWLGIHVFLSLLGYIGFALAFCAAVAYLAQSRALKRGRLNRYLPPLNSAAGVTYHSAAIGFSLFTLGLIMGIIWLLGAPGEYLEKGDTKIWMAVPTWLAFAAYLYRRGVSGQQSSRLKWLVIAGFLLALINLLGVRHDFEEPLQGLDQLLRGEVVLRAEG